jgi:hypothetical protein
LADAAGLALELSGTTIQCLISRSQRTSRLGAPDTLSLTLRLRHTTDLGTGVSIRRRSFAVVNFIQIHGQGIWDDEVFWAGRLQLEACGWLLTLDQRKDLSDVIESLDAGGGFALTHAACIERTDGGYFDVAAADDIVDVLYALMSFACGRNVSFVLDAGANEAGQQTWRRWLIPSVDAWTDASTWFDAQRPHQLNAMFARLVLRWADIGWRHAVQLGIYWYVLAMQNASTAESSIVLAFTGLELVGWFWLVELEESQSAAAFDKLGAAERLRRLLRRVGVTLSIPSALVRLVAHASSANWSDGPGALADLRNSSVHPKRRARVFDAPDDVVWDASTLARWYLELSLLALLGHEGTYLNRTARPASYGLEYVPWTVNQATE